MTARLRIAVIGAGTFGTRHIAAYARRDDVELVGVVDRDPSRAQAVADEWSVEHAFAETGELLQACQPDGVSVVTSGSDHVQPTLQALAHGCSVLLEKPITLSTRDADELAEGERRSNGFVMPAHILRFAAPYQELAAHVSAGEIGPVTGIATVRDRGRGHEQLFSDVHPALMTTIHDIDLALWISGSRAVSVTAHGRATGERFPLLVWANIEAADGSIWSLRVSWLLSEDAPGADRLEVYGTGGVAKLELRPTVAVFAERSIWVDHELTPSTRAGAIDAEIGHFCARLRDSDLPPVVTLADAQHGIAVAEAIMRSIEAGGIPIELAG